MTEHTPEPWGLFSRHGTTAIVDVDDANKEIVAWMGFDRSEIPKRVHKANARRIVACVNACKGMTTEELERCGDSMGNFMAAIISVENKSKERADAAEALLEEVRNYLGWSLDNIQYERKSGDTYQRALAVRRRLEKNKP